MARHSLPGSHPPRATQPTTSAHVHWARMGLLGSIAVVFLIAVVAAIVQWPSGDGPHVTEEFSTSSPLNRPLVNGEVTLVDAQGCTSPSTGTVFEGSPVVPLQTSPNPCRRAVVTITSGDYEGKSTQLVNYDMPGEPTLLQGDKIRLAVSHGDDGAPTMAFADYQRGSSLALWAVLLALALVFFAAWRGLRAMVGLGLTLGIIVEFLLPALAQGGSAIMLTVTTGALILCIVVPLVHGINWKSAAALGGTLASLVIAACLTSIGLSSTQVRGLGSDDNLNVLLYLPEVSVAGLLAAGFIIGTLGVLNDVTVSQASTINELAELDPQATPWRLFLGAMKVGRDHITSMVYTLVFSYAGAALPLLLLISVADRPLGMTLSSDVVATELLRSGIGALALTLAVPVTTIIAAFTVVDTQAAEAGDYEDFDDYDFEAAEEAGAHTWDPEASYYDDQPGSFDAYDRGSWQDRHQ